MSGALTPTSTQNDTLLFFLRSSISVCVCVLWAYTNHDMHVWMSRSGRPKELVETFSFWKVISLLACHFYCVESDYWLYDKTWTTTSKLDDTRGCIVSSLFHFDSVCVFKYMITDVYGVITVVMKDFSMRRWRPF